MFTANCMLQVMNSSKTDVNIFFSSRNLLQLEALLDEGDAGGEGRLLVVQVHQAVRASYISRFWV